MTAEAFDDRLQRAVDTLGDKLREQFRDDLTRELHAVLEDWKAATPPPAPQVDTAGLVRLADALRAMDSAASLSDILQTLATAAGNESARAGVFLVREGNHQAELRSFRLVGFPAQFDDKPIVMTLTSAGVLRDAVEQKDIATSASSPFDASASSEPLPPGVQAIAMPIVLAGAPIGVLYAEGAEPATMEILTRFASRALEAMTALKTARAIAEAGA